MSARLKELLGQVTQLAADELARRDGVAPEVQAVASFTGVHFGTLRNRLSDSDQMSLAMLIPMLEKLDELRIVSLDLRDELIWECWKVQHKKRPDVLAALADLEVAHGSKWKQKRRDFIEKAMPHWRKPKA